jgi:hypothetical protein
MTHTKAIRRSQMRTAMCTPNDAVVLNQRFAQQSVVGAEADRALRPAPLALAAVDATWRAADRSLHRSAAGRSELQNLIAGLNLFLRSWGNYFRTGNASDEFAELTGTWCGG